MKQFSVLVVALACAACGSDSPAAPSTTTTTIPVAQTFTLSGSVTSTTGGAVLATVRITDGINAGRSAITSAGNYSITGLSVSGFTASATAANFVSTSQGVTLTSNQTVNFQLTPTPLFTRSGVGDTVFDMPTTVSRVRITATPGNSCQNFVVKIAGRLLVNVILGTCSVAEARTHDGTYLTNGGVTEVQISSGVSWTFTEVR